MCKCPECNQEISVAHCTGIMYEYMCDQCGWIELDNAYPTNEWDCPLVERLRGKAAEEWESIGDFYNVDDDCIIDLN